MIRIYLLFCLLFFSKYLSFSQKIYGVIKDINTGETLSNVTIKYSKNITASNKYGFYSIETVNFDSVCFSAIGYKSFIIKGVKNDSLYNIFMQVQEYNLEEFYIEAERNNKTQEGIQITSQKIKEIPTLFGESDILKTILFIPGVTPVSEASNGYSVRGGAPNQNLILLDDAPVYNINHLFGFVSIVNPDAIKNAQFYKSYIPAKYGGRLSSILDIDLNDGNSENLKKELTIGLISSRFKIDGPISENTTFSISARSSYFGLFLLPTYFSFKKGNRDQYFNYWLYDLNAKIKTKINNKSNLTAGIYLGNDNWKTISGETNNLNKQSTSWGNFTFSTKYQNILKEKLFLNSQLIYSSYFQKISNIENSFGISNKTGINTRLYDIGIKETIEFFYKPNFKIIAGFDITKHYIAPSQNINTTEKNGINSLDKSLFVELEAKLNQKNQIFMGVRSVFYSVEGLTYKRIEPRLSWNYFLNNNHSLSLSYTVSNQFIHQITSNTVGLPIDLWLSSSKNIPPQHAKQISLAYFFSKKNTKFSIEIYNKVYSDLLDFKDGISLYNTSNNNFEEFIEGKGVGHSYGIEISMNKNFAKNKFDISYTLGKSRVKIDNINLNRWYYSSQDRRHNLVSNWVGTIIPDRLTISSNFIFYTGNPTTVPDAVIRKYYQNDNSGSYYPQLIYNTRNNFRFPIYHRADISITLKGTTRYHKEKLTSFGVYNIYNNTNPFYLDIKTNYKENNKFEIDLVKVGILPFLPYISYTLKW